MIDRALELLHEQNESLAMHRQVIKLKIRTCIEELDAGKGMPEDELDAYLDRLKAQPE